MHIYHLNFLIVRYINIATEILFLKLHAFINVYSEAEIKRLESIMIDNKKKNEKDAVIYAYNQIINICQEIGNAKLARDYKDSLEEYKRSNIIVTKAASESSKSSVNDNLPVL